jgi:hypothetical protein
VTSHTLLREQPIRGKVECGPDPEADKPTTAAIHGPKSPKHLLLQIDHVSMTPH